jgi:hypothetical protein
VSNPVGTLKEIFEFLGEPQPPMIFSNDRLVIGTHEKLIHNMNNQSLQALGPEGIAMVNTVVGAKLGHFGYEKLSAPPS